MEGSTLKDNEGRKVDFEKMNNARKRALYTAMWGEVDGFSIEKTGASDQQENTDKNDKTASSYRLSGSGDPDKIIINQFQIKAVDQKQFQEKYDMAVTGDGQEKKRITTLHSSSLCALLHFYNVTEKNSLTLTIKGREIKFIDSVFEFKSPVIDNPSNMDVVLIGKDKNSNKDVVLFLESKFAEYYLSAGPTCRGISKRYRDDGYYTAKLYEGTFLEKKLGLEIEKPSKVKKNPDSKFDLVSKEGENPFYIGGIKQMISHYCGIRNLLDMFKNAEDIDTKYLYFEGNNSEKDKKISEILTLITKGALVILGQIVFDHKIGNFKVPSRGNERKECFKVYSGKYEALAKEIASLTKDVPNFEIVTELLKYSDIKKIMEDKMEDKIKAFYYGK